MTNNNELLCPTCDFEYNHIIATLSVIKDEYEKVREVLVDGKHSIPCTFNYPFRTQNNLHILFTCENGHYHLKSFDGHKGIIYVDSNDCMQELSNHLNRMKSLSKDPTLLHLELDPELLKQITLHFSNYNKK